MESNQQPVSYQYISIDHSLNTPIYRQIIRSVINEIKRGNISLGQRLPSINAVSEECLIARETVVKAYKELRNRGVISSAQGKGYYFKNLNVEVELNVFLLFNKLSPHKKVIYDAMVGTLGKAANVELYVYHNEFDTFKRLIETNLDKYTHFIVISHFYGVNRPISKVLEKIPEDKLIILDRQIKGMHKEYAAVYQNFSDDIYQAMLRAKPDLQKYDRLTLVYPASSYHPADIKEGFISFCQEQGFDFQVLDVFVYNSVNIKEAYILLEEHDLVALLRTAKRKNLTLGKDIGVISYNENPLKEFIAGGITVMSTDFEQMGKTAARMLLKGQVEQVENPFHFIRRASL